MREVFKSLELLGRMPVQDLDNDNFTIHQKCEKYRKLFDQIEPPITFEEGEVLLSILTPGKFYDLQWSVLTLIESIKLSDDVACKKYEQLISSCLNKEIKSNLVAGYENR